jgi:thiosulfate reductase cytochrome b subunit
MTIFEKDALGVPSTLIAIFANVSQVIGLGFVNMFFTWIISILSIVYLVYKIKNEKSKYDQERNEEGK